MLPKIKSDHCPLLISVNGFALIPHYLKPFRFQAAWMSHGKFDEFVSTQWHNSKMLITFLKKFGSV